jgi:hypothetical protein
MGRRKPAEAAAEPLPEPTAMERLLIKVAAGGTFFHYHLCTDCGRWRCGDTICDFECPRCGQRQAPVTLQGDVK